MFYFPYPVSISSSWVVHWTLKILTYCSIAVEPNKEKSNKTASIRLKIWYNKFLFMIADVERIKGLFYENSMSEL